MSSQVPLIFHNYKTLNPSHYMPCPGSVLTAFIGVTGLIRRLSLDRCLPQVHPPSTAPLPPSPHLVASQLPPPPPRARQVLLATNKFRGTNHWIVIGFFTLCTSMYVTGLPRFIFVTFIQVSPSRRRHHSARQRVSYPFPPQPHLKTPPPVGFVFTACSQLRHRLPVRYVPVCPWQPHAQVQAQPAAPRGEDHLDAVIVPTMNFCNVLQVRATWTQTFIALGGVIVALMGNIIMNPDNLLVFLWYFFAMAVLVFGMYGALPPSFTDKL